MGTNPNAVAALRCREVCKTFVSHEGRIPVLRDCDLELAEGDIVAIVGVSGSGKTTLLKILAGLCLPDSGEILAHGRHVLGPGSDRVLLLQEETLLPWFRAITNIAFGLTARGGGTATARARAEELLTRVGLTGMGHRWPRELSGGERRRVELARALAAEPSVLLLDEPFASVDSITRKVLQQLVLDLWGDRTQSVLLTTHDIHEAVTVADRILVFSKSHGRFVWERPVSVPRPRIAGPMIDDLVREVQQQIILLGEGPSNQTKS